MLSKSLAISLFVILFPVFALATPKAFTLEGEQGFWFPKPEALEMLTDLQDYPLVKEKAKLLELKDTAAQSLLDLKDKAIELWKQKTEVLGNIADTWKQSFMDMSKTVSNKSTSIFSSTTFWFCAGALAGVGAAIGIGYALKPLH